MNTPLTGLADQREHGACGHSLLEVLIAASVFTIVLAGMYPIFLASRVTYAKGEIRTDIQQNSRAALELMSKELRMIGYDPNHTVPLLGSGSAPATTQRAIQSAAATSIRFIADVNNPAGTGSDGWGDMIEYTYDATCRQIRRKLWVWNPAASPPNFVAPQGDNGCVQPPAVARQLDPSLTTVFRYFYYDAAEINPNLKFKELASPVAAADLMGIERIVIRVVTEDETHLAGKHDFRLITDVRLRNM